MTDKTFENSVRQGCMEFYLGGIPLALMAVLLLWSIYCVFDPSNFIIFLHWSWSSAIVVLVFLTVILRHVPWSRWYVGPTILLTQSEMMGRGGFGCEKWSLKFDQIERIDWGRFGIVVYKKGLRNWELPIVQCGPYNYLSLRKILKRINQWIDAHPT